VGARRERTRMMRMMIDWLIDQSIGSLFKSVRYCRFLCVHQHSPGRPAGIKFLVYTVFGIRVGRRTAFFLVCTLRTCIIPMSRYKEATAVQCIRGYSQGALMTSLPFSAPESKSRRFLSACRCLFSSFSALRSMLASYLIRLAILRSSSFLVSASI
jgi:hypothetical protein